MTTNEKITLILSGLALALSVASTLYSAWRERRVAEREFRQRITEITDALINSVAKITQMDLVQFDQRSPEHDYVRGTEVQRTAARARQADYLITDETARLLTDVDYLTIAQAFEVVGDTIHAEHYWARTIEASQSAFYGSTNRRLYAFYLYSRGRTEDARKQYESAVAATRESAETHGDQKCVEIGWIYEDWMQSEARFQFPDRADAMHQKAMEAYQKIGDHLQRDARLANLERAFQLSKGPALSAPPVDPTRAGATG